MIRQPCAAGHCRSLLPGDPSGTATAVLPPSAVACGELVPDCAAVSRFACACASDGVFGNSFKPSSHCPTDCALPSLSCTWTAPQAASTTAAQMQPIKPNVFMPLPSFVLE